MRIHGVGSHSNTILYYFLSYTIGLSHYIFSYHSPYFPHIQLRSPISIFYIFIFWITPFLNRLLKFFWHPWVSFVKVKQRFRVKRVCIYDFFPLFITSFWIFMVHSNHICRETSPIVYVRFVIWHATPDKILPKASFFRLSFEESDQ